MTPDIKNIIVKDGITHQTHIINGNNDDTIKKLLEQLRGHYDKNIKYSEYKGWWETFTEHGELFTVEEEGKRQYYLKNFDNMYLAKVDGETMNAEKTLADYEIGEETTIHLTFKSSPTVPFYSDGDEKTVRYMDIIVSLYVWGRVIVKASPDDKIEYLIDECKKIVELNSDNERWAMKDVDKNTAKLLLNGVELDKNKTLIQSNVHHESTLQLVFKLTKADGGKKSRHRDGSKMSRHRDGSNKKRRHRDGSKKSRR